MSGSVLFLALAAKKIRDSERAAARSRSAAKKKRQEEEEKRKRSYSSGSSSESQRKRYERCIADEIREDEQLRGFFQDLDIEIDTVRREIGSEFEAKAVELHELAQKYDKERQKILNELRESGIRTEEGRDMWYSLESFRLNERRPRRGYYDYDKRIEYSVMTKFNGLELTKEMLEDPENTYYKDRYEKQKEKCDKLREEDAVNQKRLKRRKFISKLTFGPTYSAEWEINHLEKKLAENRKQYEIEEQHKTDLENFEKLTPEQKQKILAYKEATSALGEAVSAVNKAYDSFKKKVPGKEDKEVVLQAVDRVAVKRNMTQEDFEEIFIKLDKVAIKRNRDEYGRSYSYYDRDPLESTISGFVKHVYEADDGFVERNAEEIIEDREKR